MSISEYWEQFLNASGKSADEAGFSGELEFEDRGVKGCTQLSLVLSGKKTVSFSSFDAYGINREPIPVSGELYIVKDSEGQPRAIIELTDVNVVPFCDIPWELAQREGEDENIADWREKQREIMEDEAALCGFTFTDSSKIVCELFHVIYQ